MYLQTEPGSEPVVVEGLFNVTPERMYRAWTSPDEVIKWFGPAPNSLIACEIDLRIGGKWRFVLEDSPEKKRRIEGEYLEVEENRRLVFSWTFVTQVDGGEPEVTHPSKVSVTFTPDGAATRIDLRHEAIRSEDGRLGVGRGWEACFTSLQSL